jgi:hypothetical protein
MWNIVIDTITILPSVKDEFFEFIQSLPKNHRYFFISQLNPINNQVHNTTQSQET